MRAADTRRNGTRRYQDITLSALPFKRVLEYFGLIMLLLKSKGTFIYFPERYKRLRWVWKEMALPLNIFFIIIITDGTSRWPKR